MTRAEILTAFAGGPEVCPEEMARLEREMEAARAVLRAAEVAHHLALARNARRAGAARWLDSEGAEAVQAGGVLMLRRDGRGLGVVGAGRRMVYIERADPIMRGRYGSGRRAFTRTELQEGWTEVEVSDG